MPMIERRGDAMSYLLLFCLILSPSIGRSDPPAPSGLGTDLPIDPTTIALRAVLDEGRHPRLRWSRIGDIQAPLEAFYRARGYAPAWLRERALLPQVTALVDVLLGAEAQGLEVADYDAKLIEQWFPTIGPTTDPEELALFDTALTISAVRYASSLHHGRITPRAAGYRLNIEPRKSLDIPVFLGQLLEGDDPAALFSALEPRLGLYQHLKAALRDYRAASATAVDRSLNLPAKLAPGDRHADIPKLRAILIASGEPVPEAAPTDADVYDALLVDTVKHFQRRCGLEPDGVIGRETLARLQLTDAERVTQIQLVMERLRWLPDETTGPYLMVNIPSFQLFGFNGASGLRAPEMAMKVIVGQASSGRRTPVFNADMTYIVFRPHWNLPYKIAVKEMLPGALRNPAYLIRHNIEVVSGFGANSPVYAPTRENLRRVFGGELKLRQKPGPKNALGLVKFAFPNDDSVYLHSTPNQELFRRDQRDFSHGCIRVSDPVGLAEWVLKDDPDWNRDRIVQAMSGSKPKTVTLAKPLPVYIFYSTVWVNETGSLMFFRDIYGHDVRLKSLLNRGFPYPA